jgi:hypothetical protein
MKTQLTPRPQRGGFTYMSVVITMIVTGIMLMAYLSMINVQNQLTMRSQAWNRSVPVLEAGVEEAIAHLNKNASPSAAGVFNLNLASDGWVVSGTGWRKSNSIGDDYYITTIGAFTPGPFGNYPMIQSTGFVKQLSTFAWNRPAGPFLAAFGDSVPTYSTRSVQALTTNVAVFTKALVARRGITMTGQNVRTDSFDSGDTNYHDGFGHYTNFPASRWKCNGDIASNDTITNTVSIGNANIFGKVATGPYGTVNLGSAGMVGDKAWQLNNSGGWNTANFRKIQPGWSTDDMNLEFPSILVPGEVEAGTMPTGYSLTTNSVTYNMVLGSSLPGSTNNYNLQGQTLSGSIYVMGTVRMVVKAGINMSGQDCITLAPGAYLTLYADCTTASLGGNGIQNPGTAEHFYYFGTDKNTSLSYGGNAAFTAVFYAPNAEMTMGGGGSTQIDFSGSAIAKSIKLNGNFTFHYDENLKRVGLYRGYILTSWDEQK